MQMQIGRANMPWWSKQEGEGATSPLTTSDISTDDVPLKGTRIMDETSAKSVPYVCSVEECSKVFNSAPGLREHERLHSGNEPYACQIAGCGRRFKWRSSAAMHKKSHEFQSSNGRRGKKQIETQKTIKKRCNNIAPSKKKSNPQMVKSEPKVKQVLEEKSSVKIVEKSVLDIEPVTPELRDPFIDGVLDNFLPQMSAPMRIRDPQAMEMPFVNDDLFGQFAPVELFGELNFVENIF